MRAQTIRLKKFFILFLLVCDCSAAIVGRNVALGKSYKLTPKPNYKLCTDSLDKVQLTDGRTYGSWWSSKSTVGWQWASTGIEIVIDLERPTLVDQVKIHGVGGGFADVEFPEFIAVVVSNDKRTYGFAGLIGSEDLAHPRSVGHSRIPHTFTIKDLNAQGRFVKVVVRPNGKFFFLDEIEVIAGYDRLDEQAGSRKDLLRFSDSGKLLGAIEDYLQLRTNIAETIKALENHQNQFSADFTRTVSSKLQSLAEKCKLPTNKIYPSSALSTLGTKLGVIRAQIYKQVYKSDFVCFVANPMEILFEKDMHFVDVGNLQQIDVQMWQREYESAAANIINCSPEPLNIVVSVSPLVDRDGRRIDSSKTITVRRAIFVKALNVGLLADPLVLQPEQAFELPPGSVAQIWLTVYNPALGPGNYRGRLAIAASSGLKKLPIRSIGLNLTVANLIFPQDVTLNTCTWDEYTWFNSVTKDIMPIVSEDLRAHYVNVSVIHPYLIPGLRPPNKYSHKLDDELRVKDFARTYLLYLEWRSDRKDWGRFGKWMSLAWKRNFSSWLRNLVALLKEKGIGYERFALYPFDEALGDEFYQVAKLIKQTDPKVRIYANNMGKGPRDFIRFRNLIDIWCPHRLHCTAHPQWLDTIKSFGQQVWTYGGEAKPPAKSYSPYGYYRLMAWDAFARGQRGVGFWVYIDRQKHTWNDTLKPRGYYAVIYGATDSPVDTHGEEIIPSRRWEAWREGIEDYEYLIGLQKTINEVRASNPQMAADAEALLKLQVKRVVNNGGDCEVVYSARKIITRTLLQLIRRPRIHSRQSHITPK